jgi:hypothetical protein
VLFVGERALKDGVHDAENDRVGADAQSERKHGDNCERRVLA